MGAVTDALADPQSYYRQLGPGSFTSTGHAQGAWSELEQHMAPVSGLLAHALENCSPRSDLVMSRVVFDVLGMIPGGAFGVSARVVRPGRTIELVEAEMTSGGRTLVRATAWRLVASDTSAIAVTDLAPIPGPDQAAPVDLSSMWPGGYIRSIEARTVGRPEPGRATVWLRPRVDLIEGQPSSPASRLFGLIDTANGVSVRAQPREVMFPNTDLTVHLFRQPSGDWLGLETEVSFGPGGLGLTSAVLHDLTGPFGRAAQTLTVRVLD